jgi:indolepyruvate ferredoxin oxidoreductase alpha subunit
MPTTERKLLSGNEAVALAALHSGVALGTGYPGTPSSEILETFSALGGRAQWAPNEKVALEVALGAAFAKARALVTMKHVGLNVAADPLFTAAYTGVSGALVVVSADDPGMASSQNEQDNRRYAVGAALPMLEPADSQESYDFFLQAVEISEKWSLPVLFRMTTRVCHSKTIVVRRLPQTFAPPKAPLFERDVEARVMIPAYARPAHKRLRQKLDEIGAWNESSSLNRLEAGGAGSDPLPPLGIIASGVSYMHVREAAPEAAVLKLGMTYPLPMKKIRAFVGGVQRCVVIEEGDPYLVEAISAAGNKVEGKLPMYRFGELNVQRVRRILVGDLSIEPDPPKGKPPQLCQGCPHGKVFEALAKLNCIVAGDIGCYTLGVLPPFRAMDTCVCMGASITAGLGMRHVLPDQQARRVVSVIGDSTFVHSGIPGLIEMMYNPPPTGHVVLVLDNGTTAMTGLQEHPGTGKTLAHQPTHRLVLEDVARAIGVPRVHVVDPVQSPEAFEALLTSALAGSDLSLIVVRRPCLLNIARLAATGDSSRRAAEKKES